MLLSGRGGAGKSVLADEIGKMLTGARHTTAVVDLDALSQFGPPPPEGSAERIGFHERLRYKNLAAVWTTFRAAGARFVVVAGIIETAAARTRYAGCLAGCDVQLARLVAPIEVVGERIRGRKQESASGRAVQSAVEQHEVLARAGIEDFTVTNDRALPDVARETLIRAG